MTDVELFSSLGLSESKAKETAANKRICPLLRKCCACLKIDKQQAPPKKIGLMLYYLASTIPPSIHNQIEFLCLEIVQDKLNTNDKINAACKYLESHSVVDYEEFKVECGIGLKLSEEQIDLLIDGLFEEEIQVEQSKVFGFLINKAKKTMLRWANQQEVRAKIESRIQLIPKKEQKPMTLESSLEQMFQEGEMSKLHKPGENPQLNKEIMKKHLQETKGRVITRFPPEPNGYLHIGHAKAINVDFGYAKVHNGLCYLRYDDTNPEAEEKRYFDSILESVRWLGFEPDKITYSSDYFDQLFKFAILLIKKDLAYVCHCTAKEIFEQRGGDQNKGQDPCKACLHRTRPVLESLREFYRMKQGCYDEGEAVLRMKMDLKSGNPQFWDLAAYRIKYTAHYKTLDKWCVYPTYDYTHCICDSLENITHSLCTLEFRQSRESYYWLVDALEIYRPVQFETARLNITDAVLSKRKLNNLTNFVLWDDPRLFTISGLRRRGCPADAINLFVRQLGITLTNSQTDVSKFNNVLRTVLNKQTDRLMAVLDPIELEIMDEFEEEFQCTWSPFSTETRKIKGSNLLYIERSDFQLENLDFKRLTPTQCVGLLHYKHAVSYISHTSSRIKVKFTLEKPKTYIHWVNNKDCCGIKIRNYKLLLKNNEYDPESIQEMNGFVDSGFLERMKLKNYKPSTMEASDEQLKLVEPYKFQFIRNGYYQLDPMSDVENNVFVFNQTISLKSN